MRLGDTEYHRKRYRNDPEYRKRHLELSKAYVERADETTKRRIRLSKQVYNIRSRIERWTEKIQKLEIRLIRLTQDLDRTKKLIKERKKK